MPLSLYRIPQPRTRQIRGAHSGLQSPGESSMRLYALFDLSASSSRESIAHSAARWREALSRLILRNNGMTSTPENNNEAARQKIMSLRHALLRLHKTLLNMERRDYERQHGHVSTGELFRLVLDHQQFAWLHNISEFVVRLDETLAGEVPITSEDTGSAIGTAWKLFVASDLGGAIYIRVF